MCSLYYVPLNIVVAVLLGENVFSYYRMCSLTTECVLLPQNAFSYYRMCSVYYVLLNIAVAVLLGESCERATASTPWVPQRVRHTSTAHPC